MLDPQLFRQDADRLAERLLVRGYELDVEALRKLENSRREIQGETESLQSRRNTVSREIGIRKSRGEDASELMASVSTLADSLKRQQAELARIQSELEALYSEIPNIAHESVPVGKDEQGNLEMRRWGEPRQPDFEIRDHVQLGEALGCMDYDAAGRISGSRFVVLSGGLARLHRALAQYMLDLHVSEHGYTEVNAPLLVNARTLFGTSQLPKFEDDQFSTRGEPTYYLIPTSEVSLTNLVGGRIVEDDELPMMLTAHTPCFRKEAGSYGRDTRGMIRQHQFEKVELVHISRPDESYQRLEVMTGHAETVLRKLELPYRVLTLCTGDMGFAAAKTYDIEVWVPSQEKYREISSCSNTETFQARRMKSRWRNPRTGKPEYLHTLNGSGVAVGRALVAVMENYQNSDGSVTVPGVLRPYMGGQERIG